MTSTNEGTRLGGYRSEVDRQKLGPTLLIASSLVLQSERHNGPPLIVMGSHTLNGITR
jgi:hypothetical protein